MRSPNSRQRRRTFRCAFSAFGSEWTNGPSNRVTLFISSGWPRSALIKTDKREVALELKDFLIPPDDVPEERDARRAVKHWSQWIDYWAVDWNNKGGNTFHNEWQTFTARAKNKLARAGNPSRVPKRVGIHCRCEGH